MLAVSTYDPNTVNLHVITSDKQKINKLENISIVCQ